MLVDGLDIVLDLTRSGGSYLVDAITGRRYLDMFTFVASSALGMNPPALVDDREFHAELMQAALNKPSNSDVYSVAMARFVETFARVLGDPALPHLFFVEGGALAVENALKAAFDWKSRHNQAHGIDPALGTQVLHLRGAFHGRSGVVHWPGYLLIVAGVVGGVGALAAFGTGHHAEGMTFGVVAIVVTVVGLAWLAFEHRRIRKIADRWYTEHPEVRRQRLAG